MTPEPYHQVRADIALALIADGRVPSEFCNEHDPNLPSRPSSLEHWAHADASFAERLKMAKATGALVMLSRCIQIADDQTIRADQKRLMIDTRMKIAAIWNPTDCVPPKPDKEPLAGVHALLHVPFDQLDDGKKREVERFFGFDTDRP